MPSRYSLTVVAVAMAGAIAGASVYIDHRADAVDQKSLSALTHARWPDLTGNTASLEQWQGQVLVVNFWASWCPPCREEIPGLLRVQEKYGARGLQVVGIAVDTAANTQQAAREMRISYPVMVGGAQSVALTRALGNQSGGLPYTLILDPQGRIFRTHLGLITESQLEQTILGLLR